MQSRIRFILNSEVIDTVVNPATALLDFVRERRLTGTKEGCKEGDCGACTVLTGEISSGRMKYRSVNSCLIPLMNVNGKHVITIEGINHADLALNEIQKAFVAEGASQCGFCTPGFIISLAGYFLCEEYLHGSDISESLDGNICRCTGHNSIIRASAIVASKVDIKELSQKDETGKLEYLSQKNIIPGYFKDIKISLEKLQNEIENDKLLPEDNGKPGVFVGGGTDLFVQRPLDMLGENITFLHPEKSLKGIDTDGKSIHVGAGTTVTELLESKIFLEFLPQIKDFAALFGSLPIRNSATLAGNINNASPIGDMTALFMALNASVELSDGSDVRLVPLKEYYRGYKSTLKRPDEIMTAAVFEIPGSEYRFNFEKVSKRTFLDIASVNSAMLVMTDSDVIREVHISAGGVAPVPLYLRAVCGFLKGKSPTPEIVSEAVKHCAGEVTPISDARGSADYKKLLIQRLLCIHFIKLFPETVSIEQTI